MKVTCPNCQKVLQAPNEWAGRQVKCPGCKQTITLPRAEDSRGPSDLGFDLGSLEAVESAGQAVVSEGRRKPLTLKQAREVAGETQEEAELPDDPQVRICPGCHERVSSEDLYSELICRNCGCAIPSRKASQAQDVQYTVATTGPGKGLSHFYTSFTGTILFPLGTLPTIIVGMAFGFIAIIIPLAALTAIGNTFNLVPDDSQAGLGVMGIILAALMVLEGLYFNIIGYGIAIRTLNSTMRGEKRKRKKFPAPPWKINRLQEALKGYLAVLGLYLVAAVLLIMLLNGQIPLQADEFIALVTPVNLIVLALLTFTIPIHLIGLASRWPMQGLRPSRLLKSISQLSGHYVFLVLIMWIYLCIYAGLVVAAITWALPSIAEGIRKGLPGGIVPLLMGATAWAVAVGLGFYFAYVIGRLLGIFSATYRHKLQFAF